jgi:DNA polymerase-4
MDVRILWGIGEKTAAKLNGIGIRTVWDLAHTPEKTLRDIFGEYGSYLKMTASGIDDSPLVPYYRGIDPKSIGHEYTLAADTDNKSDLLSTLLRLSEQVGRRVRKEGFLCDTVTVKIRYENFKTITRQRKLDKHFERDDILFETARNLFESNYSGRKIRLLGVGASGLVRKDDFHIDPIFNLDKKHDVFVQVADSIKDRFGENSIGRGGSIRI